MISRASHISLAVLVALALILGGSVRLVHAEEDFGTKFKRIFQPTPVPKKKHKSATSSTKKSTPTPSPSASPKKKATPEPSESPTATPKKKSSSAKSSPTPSPTPEAEETPTPTPKPKSSPSPSPKGKKKKSSPSPTPEEGESPSPSPSPPPEASASPGESPTPTPTPVPKRPGAPGATISPNEISGIDNYPQGVRKVIDAALALTTRNLEYKYGSADPDSGGLDCSGFIYYLLTQSGIKDVPRDASGQYSWVRKSGKFQAVISRNDSTFELEELKPGDLLFWTGTYDVNKDPPITHTMIYLGREKKTNARIMAGSSDGRVYHGESRFGVGVFDFKLAPRGGSREGRTPTFVGYGRIPGLGEG